MCAQIPGDGRCHRSRDHVALAEGTIEIVGNEAANLLRAQVVGVVIPVAQHIGPDQDAALDLDAKALRARTAVEIAQVARIGRPMPIANAVKAAQIARGLGGGNHVVGGNGKLGARQLDAHAPGTERLKLVECRAHGVGDVVRNARTKELLGQSDSQARERAGGEGFVKGLVERLGEIFRRQRKTGRIHRIEAAHGREQQGAVLRRARHRPSLVEARGVGDEAITRCAAVGGFDAGDAAKCGGLADRSAGIRAGCRWG